MVMHYKGTAVDPATIEIKMPDLPGFGLPPLGLPPLAAPTGAAHRPGAARASGQRPVAAAELRGKAAEPSPPANDLSQPPKFN